MVFLCVLSLTAALAEDCETVRRWDFRDGTTCEAWQPNHHFVDVTCDSGALTARAVDWDPFFTCTDVDAAANSGQYVRVRLRASAGGTGQLFWTGTTSGPHGGFDPAKVTDFRVRGGDAFEDILIFPYWHAEDTIRQLRLDLYDGASFEIMSIALCEASAPESVQETTAWEFGADVEATGWRLVNGGTLLAAPPLDLPSDRLGWVTFTARSETDTAIALAWSTSVMAGSHQETVYLDASETPRHYHVELQGHPQWAGSLVGLHFEFPGSDAVTIESVTLAEAPAGPPELATPYFGFENGVNRAGRPESLLAQFTNRGGGSVFPESLELHLPDSLRLLDGPIFEHESALLHGDILEARWTVQANVPGDHPVVLRGTTAVPEKTARLNFAPPVNLAADYVPEPEPVTTSHDILAYYFPGWNASAKWAPIQTFAPMRRPLLGYYDETNVECVDWQIKWAVENGIGCFLVDWYWSDGAQSLLHWFDAYRQARYRDFLKVAIMWANHNEPGSHSREDWRAVTQEWIDRYFTLDTYYHVDGMPAVYIWDADAIRTDLGGSDEAAAALAESQEMAREAGHQGIAFIVLQHHVSKRDAQLWEQEGYHGHTSYHEWGDAYSLAPNPTRGRFADIVATAPDGWERRRSLSESLAYYPVVDTGWDSRPWHGPNATAFHDRTVAGFRALLQAARTYCEDHGKQAVILGPLNEWGEGSYIEPNLEFGFGMYEAVREVFGTGDPAAWPENISHRDVGLGPYEFPPLPRTFAWTFEEGPRGWAAMMNIANFRVEGDALCFDSTSSDPALVVATRGLNSAQYPRARIRMRVTGPLPEAPRAQLFWTIGAGATSEATSVRFPLQTDGEFHEYELDLAAHPRWRGRISTLRFDPCEFNGAQVCIDSFVFVEE